MKSSFLSVIVLVALVAALVVGSYAAVLYVPRMMNRGGSYSSTNNEQTVTMAQAVQTFKNYLTSTGTHDLALHEVEEYQNNFYASYNEQSTGRFAFQMLIWKPGASMMGGTTSGMMSGVGMMTGIAMPEPGPDMMWNTKYAPMGSMMSGMTGGMMGSHGQGSSSPMTVSQDQARTKAQQYLDNNLQGKTAGDADVYYGYYNIDVLLNGSTYEMLSVNGYTGEVWYHTWHGAYIQTATLT